MIFIILYDTTSIDIFNMENTTNTTAYEHTLGKYVVGLDALHQGRESNWIRKTLKRLSVNDEDKQNKIIETMLKGLRTKEHISLEIYTK